MLTVRSLASQPIFLAGLTIPPLVAIDIDEALFLNDPVASGTLLTLAQNNTVSVAYQSLVLSVPQLTRFLSATVDQRLVPTATGDSDVFFSSTASIFVHNSINATGGPLVAGDSVGLNGALEISKKALADSGFDPNYGFLGIVVNELVPPRASASILIKGEFLRARMVPGLTLTDGDLLYLSAAVSGKLTNIPPVAPPNNVINVGTLLDGSGYKPTDPNPFAFVLVRPPYTSTLLGAVGGDLSGVMPSPLVTGLRGKPISPAVPTIGQVYTFDGVSWSPSTIASGIVTDIFSCPPALTVGAAVYVSGIDTVDFASSSGVGLPKYPAIGFVVNKPTAITATVIFVGAVAGFVGLIPKATYFLNLVLGGITDDPSGFPPGSIRQKLGVAKSATTLILEPNIDFIIL